VTEVLPHNSAVIGQANHKIDLLLDGLKIDSCAQVNVLSRKSSVM